MARKDRAPNPPKRPQAPQRRSTPSDPAAKARQRRLLAVIAGSGLAALAIVLAIIFFTAGGDSGERAALEAAGCTLQSFPALPNKSDHSDVPTLTTKPKWNSNAADERAALRRDGGLGLLRRAGPARADARTTSSTAAS